MSVLRPSMMLRLRPALTKTSTRAQASMQVRFATQGYGGSDGNPTSEKPQEQGRGREDLEHPGPSPPKVAKSDGKSTSSPSSSQAKSSEKSDSSSAKDSSGKKGSDAGEAKEGSGKGRGKPQPKILNVNPPSAENESEDVKRHNKNMEGRAEKAHEQIDNKDAKNDKVPPKI